MLKTTIIQRGVEKQVPAKHAKILVAIGKASYAPMPDDEDGHGETVDTDAPMPDDEDGHGETVDTDAPMPDDEDGHGETVDTDAPKPKRTYVRKDLRAEE